MKSNERINKVTVVGAGYVGLSLAVLLSQKVKTLLYDIDKEKINLVNQKISPIDDAEIIDYLKNKSLNLRATDDKNLAYKNADYVIIAVPTDYDEEKKYFNTTVVESVIRDCIETGSNPLIIIKSTIPVGFTKKIKEKLCYDNIVFSPEFLRESKALYDNLYPSRIIVGVDDDKKIFEKSQGFAHLLRACSEKCDTEIIMMHTTEAEAVKLFANSYLAMRVSFFNELDTYSELKGLDTESIIRGVCLDPRIGDYYNNPSFGYGGYCLPKDTKQLLNNYEGVPGEIVKAVVQSNETRKNFVAEQILKRARSVSKSPVVGIYRLTMKTDSDNFRQSAIFDVMRYLKNEHVRCLIYEPRLADDNCISLRSDLKEMRYLIEGDFDSFCRESDIIVANRYDNPLSPYKNKVYTRDLFGNN